MKRNIDSHSAGRPSTLLGSWRPQLHPRLLLLLLLLLFLLVGAQEPPPNYSQDRLPDTDFTCSDKATGGYYADPQAGCQMFHVCVRVSDEEIRDFRFLCPNNTVFDQQNFICTNWYDIDCKRSTKYYSKNDLFRVEEEETTTESEYPEYQQPLTYYEYVYEYDDPQSRADADYMYEYYDGEDNKKHRFDARARNRKGKSQDATGNNTNTLPSSTPTTTTSTTTTTTTTTSTTTPRPTTRPTTTTTTSTTTTTRRPPPTTYIHTTPLPITTLRPSLAFHTGTFRVGRPVVSITSSTKRESTSASGPDSRFDASPTRSTRQEEELNDHEVDELYRGVQDPFADIDWRRDSATSVTASTKTTYEQRFGTSGGIRNRQNSPHFSTASRNQEFTSTTMRNSRLAPTVTSTTEKVTVDNRRGTSSRGRGTVVRNRGSTGFTSARNRGSTGFTSARDRGSTGFTSARDRGSTGFTSARARQAAPDPGLEEFSNFRYYRTAFGDNGEAELPTSSAQNPRGRQQPTSASGRSATGTRVRPAGYISARSASRNTRYAVYG